MPPVNGGAAAGPSSGSRDVHGPAAAATAAPKRNRPRYHAFTQQQLPACKPILAPNMVRPQLLAQTSSFHTLFFSNVSCFTNSNSGQNQVIPILVFVGLLFIPIGLACYAASNKVFEVVYRYDTKCVPKNMLHNKVGYIQNASINKTCTINLKIPNAMKRPIFIYYQLDRFYQNHRRYATSFNIAQLSDPKEEANADIKDCKPEAYAAKGIPVVPCGLVAWSLFNDTYSFARRPRRAGGIGGVEALRVIKSGISWRSERERLFGKHVYPKNFQNGSLVGGGRLDPRKP
uniref:ALA-interacting subunit n=1 Tax=Aegilops tauschii subsp. strangulata TaxID=200361 RepID=A0A453LQZ7_AEGTS